MPWRLLMLPLTAALVGWVTNVVAVRLLFRPLRPIRVPRTPWSIQGVIPRRQGAIATSIGRLVEERFLQPRDLLASVDGSLRVEVAAALENYVSRRLDVALPAWVPAGIRSAVKRYAVDRMRREADGALDSVVERLQQRLASELRVGSLVAARVRQLELADFEASLLGVIGSELRWIEVLGAIMGFAIGLVQMLIAWPW
ncbi:DUF445 domain-containing protein [Geochorda subterranea]|uniref:DUF445 family protein n=1 Tax=Geochorda subterranea TaxID=3109564 RepID=A0ABZ1BS83_9FIRM|nr:DUF445 family protein [Limnochorda sp. LNt]WRP15670.1 DUF445 family protein [Limnochorda sp. LNt]